jgi:hypothetical protein
MKNFRMAADSNLLERIQSLHRLVNWTAPIPMRSELVRTRPAQSPLTKLQAFADLSGWKCEAISILQFIMIEWSRNLVLCSTNHWKCRTWIDARSECGIYRRRTYLHGKEFSSGKNPHSVSHDIWDSISPKKILRRQGLLMKTENRSKRFERKSQN